MGIVLWVVSGFAASFIARIVPIGSRRRWPWELLAAVAVAFLLGVVATALDFGGWKEPDWRAGLFCFFGALAAVGVIRGSRRGSPPSPAAAAPPDRRPARS